MNKYIDADKLIKSVNNYQEGAKAALNLVDGYSDYYKGKIVACEDIKAIITYLQQEQPEVDLEKEIYNLYDGEYHDTEDIARHFYELGRLSNK